MRRRILKSHVKKLDWLNLELVRFQRQHWHKKTTHFSPPGLVLVSNHNLQKQIFFLWFFILYFEKTLEFHIVAQKSLTKREKRNTFANTESSPQCGVHITWFCSDLIHEPPLNYDLWYIAHLWFCCLFMIYCPLMILLPIYDLLFIYSRSVCCFPPFAIHQRLLLIRWWFIHTSSCTKPHLWSMVYSYDYDL